MPNDNEHPDISNATGFYAFHNAEGWWISNYATDQRFGPYITREAAALLVAALNESMVPKS